METAYGFTKLVRTSEQAQTNRRLSRKLGSINFYCRVCSFVILCRGILTVLPRKDTKTGDDPYENPTISTAITTAYFSDTKALGVKFPKSFNPIPLPAVALVLTLVCSLLSLPSRATKLQNLDAIYYFRVDIGLARETRARLRGAATHLRYAPQGIGEVCSHGTRPNGSVPEGLVPKRDVSDMVTVARVTHTIPVRDSVAGSNKSQPGQSQPIFRADRVRPPTPPVDRAGTGQSSSQSKGKKPVKH